MKTWYKAVCDKCGEARDIFVSNPSCTASYLSKYDRDIQAWLEKHYCCELRLIWRDDQLDHFFDKDGFKQEGNEINKVYKKDQK